jgi:hypothetical protein
MNDDHWGPEEQARLARARVPVTPRAGDEDRLVAVLRERGLLRARRRRGAIAALGAVAAALVLAAVWLTTPRQPPVAPAASRYVLLLYAGTDPVEAAASAARRREYAEWARGVASGGVAISGEELADESRTVGAAASPAPDPLPRGFFVVSAPDLDAAERIAATCPHLRYGGRIVIQRVAG